MGLDLSSKNINTQTSFEGHTSVIKGTFKVVLHVGDTLYHVEALMIKDLICQFFVDNFEIDRINRLENRKYCGDNERLHMRKPWALDGSSLKVSKDVLLIGNSNMNSKEKVEKLGSIQQKTSPATKRIVRK